MEHTMNTNIKEFILGGNSEFSIRNSVSGKGAKYRIKRNGAYYFVRIKDGSTYKYAGFLKQDKDSSYVYARGMKGAYDRLTPEVKGLMWMLAHSDNKDERICFIHHGRCACCGKPLDDELSINRGFGPVCYKKMQYH